MFTGHRVLRVPQVIERALTSREKRPPGIGHDDLSRRAMEQPHSERTFELGDPPAEGRQRNANGGTGSCGWRITSAIWRRYPFHSTCSGTCEEGDYVPPITWIRNLVSHLLSGYERLRICEPAVEVGRGPADAGVLEGG